MWANKINERNEIKISDGVSEQEKLLIELLASGWRMHIMCRDEKDRPLELGLIGDCKIAVQPGQFGVIAPVKVRREKDASKSVKKNLKNPLSS